MRRPSGTCTTPDPTIEAASRPMRDLPSKVTVPVSTLPRCRPRTLEMVRSSVDLPAPLLPRTATTLPSGTWSVMPRRASTAPPYVTLRSSTSSTWISGWSVALGEGAHHAAVTQVTVQSLRP